MIKLKIYLFLCLIQICSSISYAADNTNSFWLGTFTKKSITKDLSLLTEAQLRFDRDQNEMQQTLFRTGLIHNLSGSHALGLLYAYVETGEQSEHRLALQHTQSYGSIGRVSISHRLRLEARRFENIGYGSARVRYLTRFQAQSKSILIPVLWDEIFLNAREEERTGNTYFDRNRFFVGFRREFKTSGVSAEFGYLNQYIPREAGDVSQHTIVFYLFL